VYTRCPQCQTTFRLTAAQLKARDGKVRCGRCQNVFQAEQHLVPQTAKPAKGPARKRATRKPASTAPDSPARAVDAKSPGPSTEPATSNTEQVPEPIALSPRRRNLTPVWTAGSALLTLAALAQVVVFYGQSLVRQASWLRPVITGTCQYLPCRLLAPIDLRQIDLSETRVTPHPRYDRVLRVKATITNRADYAQPYPLLEVSLIDHQGLLVARRAYPPRDYLGKSEAIASGLPPHVAVHVGLDITSPGTKASGYEVLLLPPSD